MTMLLLHWMSSLLHEADIKPRSLFGRFGWEADFIGSFRVFPVLTWLRPSESSAFVDLVAAERLGVAFKAEARTEGVAIARP